MINLVTHLVTNLVTYFVTNFVINFVTNVMENIVDDDDISVLQQKASLLNLFTSGRVLSFQSKPYQALTIKQTKSVKENYRKVKVRNHKLVFNNQKSCFLHSD